MGILYITFEKSLLKQSATSVEGLRAADGDIVSHTILGAQVGLIGLAMIVTRSSVASLQAKTGLPLGTQVLGWVTLGKCLSVSFFHATPKGPDFNSGLSTSRMNSIHRSIFTDQ